MTSRWCDVLGLPEDALHDGKLPKKLIVEQGKPRPDEETALEEHVAEIRWVGNLKPSTVARAASAMANEIQVLVLALHDAVADGPRRKLAWLLHRAVQHYPLLVVAEAPDGSAHLSTKAFGGTSRDLALRETEQIGASPDPVAAAFLGSLSLARQPFADLGALYEGWHGRIVALAVARELGADFRSPSQVAAQRWAEALDELAVARRERARVLREIAKEHQPARAHSLSAKRVELDATIDRLRDVLVEDPSPPSLHP